jgi:hypothetical protein
VVAKNLASFPGFLPPEMDLQRERLIDGSNLKKKKTYSRGWGGGSTKIL